MMNVTNSSSVEVAVSSKTDIILNIVVPTLAIIAFIITIFVLDKIKDPALKRLIESQKTFEANKLLQQSIDNNSGDPSTSHIFHANEHTHPPRMKRASQHEAVQVTETQLYLQNILRRENAVSGTFTSLTEYLRHARPSRSHEYPVLHTHVENC